jgi:hypothetical protein
MANTERTGRVVHNFASEVLILPQGGLPVPAPEGAVTIEGGDLYLWTQGKWNKITMTPVSVDPGVTTSDLTVAGAGSVGCNGSYVNQGAGVWRQPSTTFYVSRIDGYPTPGALGWAIRRDTTVFYAAQDCPLPWNAVWQVSLGTAPVPTVVEVPK